MKKYRYRWIILLFKKDVKTAYNTDKCNRNNDNVARHQFADKPITDKPITDYLITRPIPQASSGQQ